MMIRTPVRKNDEPRILKVRLPLDMHIQLHSIKILTGRSISDAVEEALTEYFAVLGAAHAASAADADADAPAAA